MPIFRVFSFHQGNLPEEMLAAQRAVFAKMNIPLEQYYSDLDHGRAIDECLHESKWDAVALFDADAFVVDPYFVRDQLEKSMNAFSIVGGAHNANHRHDSMDYASPACCIFSRKTWQKAGVGFETFYPDYGKGWMDVGQRFSEKIRRMGGIVGLTDPVSVDNPMWKLHSGLSFGTGTHYGWAYHQFQGRNPEQQQNFIHKCQDFVDSFFMP